MTDILLYFAAESRVKNLESELEESQALTRRYRDMYVIERDRARPQTSTRRGENKTPRDETGSNKDAGGGKDSRSIARSKQEDDGGKKEKVTEDDLDDDEAMFKRHIAKIAEMKAMHTTSPIRIEDIIRKSEVREKRM